MKDKKFKGYIIDTITLLKEQAREAKKDADNPKEGFKDYAQGIIMGYYSIITLLKHQAFTFCLDQKELGLADVIPDIDLLGLHRNPDIDFGEDNWAIDVLNEERIKGYLSDSITLLKKQAREAKKDADNPKEGFKDYSKGLVVAYCSVISLLKHQAFTFNIDEQELGLADINPEEDLLGPHVRTQNED
jgi:hypothetical protein